VLKSFFFPPLLRCEKRYLVADYFGKKALELFEKRLEKCVLQTKTSKENNNKSAKEDSCQKGKFER